MKRSILRSILAAVALASLASLGGVRDARAQFGGFINRSVGGVAISPEGVLEAPTTVDQQALEQARQQARADVPAALGKFVELRAVSLRQLEAVVAKAAANHQPIPDEVRFLAGLQRVRYVFVYPDQHDIVLAGPAEGWKVDQLGNVVGQTTNRPVLLLDDLMVALRSGGPSRMEAITCSIDPTAEGMAQLQAVANRLRDIGNPEETLGLIEHTLGPQTVSVTGVLPTTHFARTMVAADFRMKRLAMNFEPAPIDGMPSFLDMMSAGTRGMSSMMPRWWLAPNYQPLAKTADGMAWELRGQGVKCMTEEDYIAANGQKQHTGKANPIAQKWANTMTKHFDELAAHDSSFGQLRNIMDLAVIGALIEKEQLFSKAGLQTPKLMGEQQLASYPAPHSTASKASAIKRGSNWIISASGGVEILPWSVADKSETVDSLGDVRSKLTSDSQSFWRQ